MTGAFPCATIQQPKEKWDQRCISVFLSSKVSQYHKGDWHGKNEWSWKAKGGKRTMHLVKCEWLQLGEPAADLQCALPRNWASQNWNDSMLDDSSRLKSRQCECHLLCPLAIFFITFTHTQTHTQECSYTHTYAHTHTYTLWEHQQLYPSVLFWLNTWSKHERPWRISAKFFKLCQRSDSQRHIPTPLLPPLHRVVVATPPSDTPCRNWSVWCRGADDSAETGSVPHLGRSGG